MTLIVENADEFCLEEIGKRVKGGETCIYPTETCYGLGTNALKEEAVEKIYEVKKRDRSKKLPCIVSSVEMAEKYCDLGVLEKKICKEFMPGPITIVASKKDSVPNLLNTDFVFRVPSDETARMLVEKSGVPIVSTSANFSGARNNYRIEDISRILRDRIDIIIDCGELDENMPSTVVKVTGGKVEVLREGPIPEEKIKEL